MSATAWTRSAVVAGTSALLAGLLMLTSPMRRLDLWSGDLQARLATSPRSFSDAIVVAIDDESIARLEPVVGNWPYDRGLYARVTDYLTHAGATAIVFDILFADERDGDRAFAEALRRAAPTTLAAVAAPYAMPNANGHDRRATRGWHVDSVGVGEAGRSWQDVELPLPDLAMGSRIGIANLVPDEDGVVRRISLLHEVGGVWLPALPFAAVFPGPQQPDVHVERGVLRAFERSWPIDRHGDVQLLFSSAPHAIPEVPFYQLASAALDSQHDAAPDEQTRALFHGRTVFIGATALLIGPANETPVGQLPGVVLVGQAFASLQHDQVLAPRSWAWDGLLLVVTLVVPFAIRTRRSESIRLLALGALAGLMACWAFNWLLLATLRQPASLVFPMLAGMIAFVAFLAEKVRALRLVRQRLASERVAAERTAALKQEFLVHVSHELRTPLTAIIGFSGMLADDGTLDAEKRTLAQVARRNAEQLLWQVNNLLDQARIAAGQMLIDPCPTPIGDVMDHVMATLAGVPRRPGVELRCSGLAQIPAQLTIDGQRLQQILINLGANALKFTDRGVVHIVAAWEAGWLTVKVEDTGHGIPSESLERIFEPFEQSPSQAARRNGTGTGLGLTISRNLARLMGGELTVTSVVDVGSTFCLRVPAEAVPVTRALPAAAAPATATVTRGPAAVRAVVADDSEDIRTFLTVSLRRMGIEVTPAENGEAAVAATLAEQADLVLLDVQMPVMGGPEAAHALRRAGFAKLLVALTAGSGDALESDLRAAGFDAVIFKPVTGAHLATVITTLLASQRDTPAPTAPVAKAAGLT